MPFKISDWRGNHPKTANFVDTLYNRYIGVGTFIYLTASLIAILTGVKIVASEFVYIAIPIAFASAILIIYPAYKISKELFPKPKDPDSSLKENETLTYRDVEFAIYCLSKKIDEQGLYLFSWDKIIGNDKLREFLEQSFNINWVRTAKIEKIDDGRAIEVFTEKNYLSLKLNNERTEVSLKIDDGRTDKFVAKIENGKINIYKGFLIQSEFDWDKIPGNDKLKEFLEQSFNINWVRTAKIEKIDDGKTISVSSGNNSILLSLNNEKTKLNIKIKNQTKNQTYELKVKLENGKLKYYDLIKNKIIGIDRGGAIVGSLLAKAFSLRQETVHAKWLTSADTASLMEKMVSKNERILLVTDIMRTGKTMEEVACMTDNIIKKNSKIKYKTACVLYTMNSKKLFTPDFFVYTTCTHHSQRKPHMPWDILDNPGVIKSYEQEFKAMCNKSRVYRQEII